MHVLIIAQYFPPDMGGGATRAYNVAKGLVLNGVKVTVITAFPHYPHGKIPQKYRWKPLVIEHMDGIRVIRTLILPLESKGLINRLILFITFMITSLFAIPIVGKIDVIWAANPNIISFFPAMIYGTIFRRPVTMNVDDLWPEDLYFFGLTSKDSLLFKIGEQMARIAYHKAKAITPISPGYVPVIVKRYGANPNKVHVVRAGVDTNKFKPMKVLKEKNKFIVLYSGAFSVAYDFDQVLKAAKLLEKHKDIEIVLQGGGELLPEIKKKVKELGLKNVKIIDKILSREEVAKLLNTADALLLPLRDFGRPYLGISSKLYEYQAVGKPIICCAEGQPAKYIKETGSGVVVAPHDYRALAEAILNLKNNPKLCDKMGVNGRGYVEKNVSIDRLGSYLTALLVAILYGNLKR
ncbi:hypothetical protein DRJ17_05175 [Candidatus Woesearchaeota archaeon]|nr:MAG: hypothetical protein DRJ17_05175 [Candidatus Woesearchaeota archaeon]